MAEFTSLLTSSHLDIKVPLISLPPSSPLSHILVASSRRSLFFGNRFLALLSNVVDESVSLFIIFRLSADAANGDQLNTFLKEIILNIEVAITDTPRQSDATAKREKFEGAVVYSANIPETSDKTIEKIDGQWYVAWNTTVTISNLPPWRT